MIIITKGQHVTITNNGKQYTGVAIRADKVESEYLGQFIVIRLDKPIGQTKTYVARVNGTGRPFNFDPATAIVTPKKSWYVAMDDEGDSIVINNDVDGGEFKRLNDYMTNRGDQVLEPIGLTYRGRNIAKVFMHATGSITFFVHI